jgi:hypothetical protein
MEIIMRNFYAYAILFVFSTTTLSAVKELALCDNCGGYNKDDTGSYRTSVKKRKPIPSFKQRSRSRRSVRDIFNDNSCVESNNSFNTIKKYGKENSTIKIKNYNNYEKYIENYFKTNYHYNVYNHYIKPKKKKRKRFGIKIRFKF